jgi:RNA polymerase sigma-70 factor (ECF subfamily)
VVRREHDRPDDDALVAAVSGRDHEALGEIYRRYGGAVWSVARHVCGRAELAKEVCRAVFTELWSRPERFDPAGGGLRSWLVAQAHARAVHSARSHDAHRRQDGDARTEHTPPSAEVEIAVHARALTETGRRAIDQLVPAERETVLLAYFGGHTISETARLLDSLEDTVKNHLHSGLLNLRRALQVEGVTT